MANCQPQKTDDIYWYLHFQTFALFGFCPASIIELIQLPNQVSPQMSSVFLKLAKVFTEDVGPTQINSVGSQRVVEPSSARGIPLDRIVLPNLDLSYNHYSASDTVMINHSTMIHFPSVNQLIVLSWFKPASMNDCNDCSDYNDDGNVTGDCRFG